MNLRTIPELARKFGVPAGLSDHTMGIAVPVAAVALGACIIEKHLTLSRADHGPDSAFSLEPEEFRAMVDAVRFAEKALGEATIRASAREQASLKFRRSSVCSGRRKDRRNIHQQKRALHPAGPRSAHPTFAGNPGRRAVCDIERGTPLSWDLVSG